VSEFLQGVLTAAAGGAILTALVVALTPRPQKERDEHEAH
jgi:hypothetical protein